MKGRKRGRRKIRRRRKRRRKGEENEVGRDKEEQIGED